MPRGGELTKVAVAVDGWNAEAAIGFALAARKFASSVTLTSSRETVDGKDEIEVMTLGPERGEEILMAVDGSDEKEAFMELLASLLGVIEPQKDRTAAVNGPDTLDRKKTAKPPRRRLAEVAALDVEEVAPPKKVGAKGLSAFVSCPHSNTEKGRVSLQKTLRRLGKLPSGTRLLGSGAQPDRTRVKSVFRELQKELPSSTAKGKAKRGPAKRIASVPKMTGRAAQKKVRSARPKPVRRRPHQRKK